MIDLMRRTTDHFAIPTKVLSIIGSRYLNTMKRITLRLLQARSKFMQSILNSVTPSGW